MPNPAAELNLEDTVSGELEKNSFISLSCKEGHLILCVLTSRG